MNIELKIFSGNANPALAHEICTYLGQKLGEATVSSFSDGEIRVKVDENVRGADVFVVQSTCQPVNDSLLELLIIIDAPKRSSANRITAVIPYFGYAGVQYGRRGVLETRLGDIPVYPSVREVLSHGHAFDVGVVYLPPLGVAQAVAELVRTNEALKRIVVVTEKVPARDSASVRALCQESGVDVIGANSLGVANAWDQVRVGGSLGGDAPGETLRKGSIAIHSNSGNFTTTMAEYLRTAGFGVSTAVSSGKDVYIHFALPEFLWAAQNDPRTKAVVLYVEPGGYYERIALDLVGLQENSR